jgi:hypothetical protein
VFQQGVKSDAIQKGRSMNICYHIEENEWNGVKNIQLNINIDYHGKIICVESRIGSAFEA